MVYETDLNNENKHINLDNYHIQTDPKSLGLYNLGSSNRSMSYQCTAIDFIRTLIKTGQFALMHLNLNETDLK